MITVAVRLYSILRHRPGRTEDQLDGQITDRIELEFKTGATIRDILNTLDILNEQEILIQIDDEPAGVESEILDGDVIKLIPLISGG
ncbi:MAG: MoaD/ThiS family protein [Anaerolineales bacterium]|nr:MoaD/ThiS family protein [Anaerolineales bacterium]